MRSKRCETCRHFEQTGFEGDYYDGTCRIRSVPCTTFPSRKYNEWCGEWACDDSAPRSLVAECPKCGCNNWRGPADEDGNVACTRCGWINSTLNLFCNRT